MDPLTSAKGDCGNCIIAVNFSLRRFSRVELDRCIGCQARRLPERHIILVQMEEEGRQAEEAIAENVGVLAAHLRNLKGGKVTMDTR